MLHVRAFKGGLDPQHQVAATFFFFLFQKFVKHICLVLAHLLQSFSAGDVQGIVMHRGWRGTQLIGSTLTHPLGLR